MAERLTLPVLPLREVVLSSALGDGATKQWVDRDMTHWDDADPHTRSSLRRRVCPSTNSLTMKGRPPSSPKS